MKETIKITTVEKNRKEQYNRVSHQKQKFLQFFPSLSIFRNKLNKKRAKHIRWKLESTSDKGKDLKKWKEIPVLVQDDSTS